MPSPPPQNATLRIDLSALVRNYQAMRERAGVATAAVVKADAYGLGAERVVPVLRDAGCACFFVAQAQEGETVRTHAPDADIYILNGYATGYADYFRRFDLRPCLATPAQIASWRAESNDAPAALYLDTGFNRLGLDALDLDNCDLDGFTPSLIMSHLACADTPAHKMNAAQLERFHDMSLRFENVPRSLANSGGVWLGADYAFELVRVGIALYGGSPTGAPEHALDTVVTLTTRILQKRAIAAGETVGYGAHFTAPRNMEIAILPIGYADGILRRLGRGTPPFANLYVEGNPAPIIGAVSMDLLAIDVSDCTIAEGASVEIIGAQASIDALAKSAQTISYELLTALGMRYNRVYH